MPKSKFVPADAFLARLSPAVRKAARARAAEIRAEMITLRELRKARDRTQAEVAEILSLGQDQVSRLERRSDMLLSTLRKYVASLGGSLHVVVEFPDRPALKLSDFSDVFGGEEEPARRRRVRRRAA